MCSIQTIAMPRAAQLADRRRPARRPRRRSGRRRSRRAAAPAGRSPARARARAACGASSPRLSAAPVGERQQAAELEHLDRSGRRRLGRGEPRAVARADEDVLEHRHAAERARHLVRAADAEAAAPAGAQPRHVVAAEADRARASGASEPASTFSSVVLPAPFGPTMPTASPAPTREVDAVEHHERAEALARRPTAARTAPSAGPASAACQSALRRCTA